MYRFHYRLPRWLANCMIHRLAMYRIPWLNKDVPIPEEWVASVKIA